MRLSITRLVVLLSFITWRIPGVSAAPAPQVSDSASPSVTSNPSACASVASISSSFRQVNPAAAQPTVPATLAIACLQTVPNKPEPAQRLIKSLQAFAEWQSTLAFLKDPPPSYPFPPVDVQAGLDDIASKAAAGEFNSEYEFQLAIVRLIASCHDGHFLYIPDVFDAFRFRNDLAKDLVPVSVDGVQLPKLYHASELGLFGLSPGNDTSPRAIVRINGEDAATFIERHNLLFSRYQDPDSQWNAFMRNYARREASNYLAGSVHYTGPGLTLTYDNGNEITKDSLALVAGDFTGVNTGEDFYNRFCSPRELTSAAASATVTVTITSTSSATTGQTPTIPGYPYPVVRDNGADMTSGYFLNGTGYEDVAVLAVSSFHPPGIDWVQYMTNFQQTIENFLGQCRQQNKRKLVVDLTANGGGYVIAPYELFAQLFPEEPMFGAHNLRASESLRQMAETVAPRVDGLDCSNLNDLPGAFAPLIMNHALRSLIPCGVYKPDGSAHTSVSSILGPVTLNNDLFTAYQFNPNNETSPLFNLTGTGHRSSPPPAVFKPEDVVLLTDGTCGSACTLFAYLMIFQLNVRSVAVGGRPRAGPMQSVGGVEGGPLLYFQHIADAANVTIALNRRKLDVPGSEIVELDERYALRRGFGTVNGGNFFSRTDAQTPLQFLYQPANCRVFYTREMLDRPEETWKSAVDATWTDPERFCVEGSRVEVEDYASKPMDPRFVGGDPSDGRGENAATDRWW